MKKLLSFFVLIISDSVGLFGQTTPTTQSNLTALQVLPQPTSYQIAGLGANQRVWQRMSYQQGTNGTVVSKVQQYVELGAGMNFWRNGQWLESQEKVSILPNGSAAATNGQHQAYFPGDIYGGGIKVITPDGKPVASRPAGLYYYDGSHVAMIATLTNSLGQMVDSNKVVYPDAFAGLHADILYTYSRAGFEQDILLRQSPPPPEVFGLSSTNARLQVFTEFFNQPDSASVVGTHTDVDGATDTTLGFGSMKMIPGKAFYTETPTRVSDVGVPVYKNWLQVQGRSFLVEDLRYASIQAQLGQLQAGLNRPSKTFLAETKSSYLRTLPAYRPIQECTNSVLVAKKSDFRKNAVVLDYVLLNMTVTNFTFQADTTYLVSPYSVWIQGTTTIEGGTVIKFATNSTPSFVLNYFGSLVFNTSAYHPAVFTAADDNTVGQQISGSTGTPSGYYGNSPMVIYNNGAVAIHDVRMAYLTNGFNISATSAEVDDVQALNCFNPFSLAWANLNINNSLFWNIGNTAISVGGGTPTVNGTQLTVHNCNVFANTTQLGLTNVLLVNVTNLLTGGGTLQTNSVYFSANNAVFQSVGGGNHYLASGTYQGLGSASLPPWVQADLANKTTYPPVFIAVPQVYFYTNITLSPSALRDTNSAHDIGYHYAPLDYIFSPIYVTNATVTLNPGTAVGVFGTNSYTYGFALSDNSHFVSVGTPTSLNHIVEYNTVQEQTPAGWIIPSYALLTHFSGSQPYSINCQFTDWSVMAQDVPHGQFAGSYMLSFNDCQFHGGSLLSYYPTICLSNCLLERVNTTIEPSDTNTTVFRNNTIWNGTFAFGPAQTNSVIRDNLFDGPDIPDGLAGSGVSYYGGHNAFVSTNNTLDPLFPGDIVLSNSPAYQSSMLGNYYLPTGSQLINAGSTAASQVGLYGYTTQTNQAEEANSTVSIGYHYVALGSNGQPLITDSNGIPDYLYYAKGTGQTTIILTAPANNQYFLEPANVLITAAVSSSVTVTNVSFLYSNTPVGGVNNSPFQYNWPVVPKGIYTLTAVAQRIDGLSVTSAPVSISVTNLCGNTF